MSAAVTRVVLVEDHRLLAESMAIALAAEGFDLTVASLPSECSPTELVQQVLASRPDIALLDLDLGAAGDGAPLIGPLRRRGCGVVVVTGAEDQTRWGECLARGAHTVLPKSAPLAQIADTMHRVSAGYPAIAPSQRDELVDRWRRQHDCDQVAGARLSRLTPRERQVLAAMVSGRRVREISADSIVSEATVRSQVKSILAKLRVTSQIAAVAIARDAGWRPVG